MPSTGPSQGFHWPEVGSTICEGRFIIYHVLGKGGFGIVHSGYDFEEDRPVAIKFSIRWPTTLGPRPVASRSSGSSNWSIITDVQLEPSMVQEYETLKTLAPLEGFPKVIEFGSVGRVTFMVMTSLGKCLYRYFCKYEQTFSLQTLLKLLDQLIRRLQALHETGLIHGDIKPDNILMERGTSPRTVYLIDFGLSCHWKDPVTGQHVKLKRVRRTYGTTRFMSVHTHDLITRSRRDDVISLGYTVAYFTHHGYLPWEVYEKNDGNYHKIIQMKKEFGGKQLFKGYPEAFATFMDTALNMGFEQEPPYDFFIESFREIGKMLEVDYDEPIFMNIVFKRPRK